MLRVYQITLPFDHPPEELQQAVAEKLGILPTEILSLAIVKRSLDARPFHKPKFIYSVSVTIQKPVEQLNWKVLGKNVEIEQKQSQADEDQPIPGTKNLQQRPIIVGTGPGGLFAGYWLAQNGYCPILLEQGEAIEQRHKTIETFFRERKIDPRSNYVFGEGGAGTYSDGKLYTGVSSSWLPEILSTLVKYGGPPEIQYQFPPHIGSDRLRGVMIQMRKEIIALGGEFRFQHCLQDFVIQENKIVEVVTDRGHIPAHAIILAPGGHCSETFSMLKRLNVAMELKPFQMGVRIEHPQEWINRRQYKKYSHHPKLPPASYRLVTPKNQSGHQVCSFCMCPGGEIIPAGERHGVMVTNGMSNYKRNSGFANSALVTTIIPQDLPSNDPLVGLMYRNQIEERAFVMGGSNFSAPAQFAGDFLRRKISPSSMTTSYRLYVKSSPLDELFPSIIGKALASALPIFDQQIPDFVKCGLLLAPETRASCPVRMPRDVQTRQSPSYSYLYPVGEGAGYAGGIISAALDGIRTAVAIIREFAPIKN